MSVIQPKWLEIHPATTPRNIEEEFKEIDRPAQTVVSRIRKPWKKPNQVLSKVAHRIFELEKEAHTLDKDKIKILDSKIELLNGSIERHNKRIVVRILTILAIILPKCLCPTSVLSIKRLFTVASMQVPLSVLEERQLKEREQILQAMIDKTKSEKEPSVILPELLQIQARLKWERNQIQTNKSAHQWSEQPTALDAYKAMDEEYPKPEKEDSKTPSKLRTYIKDEWNKILKQQAEERRAYDALNLGASSQPAIPAAPKVTNPDLATITGADFFNKQLQDKKALLTWLKESADPKLAANYSDLQQRLDWEESYLTKVTNFDKAVDLNNTMETQYKLEHPGKEDSFTAFPQAWDIYKTELNSLFAQQKKDRAEYDRLRKPSTPPETQPSTNPETGKSKGVLAGLFVGAKATDPKGEPKEEPAKPEEKKPEQGLSATDKAKDFFKEVGEFFQGKEKDPSHPTTTHGESEKPESEHKAPESSGPEKVKVAIMNGAKGIGKGFKDLGDLIKKAASSPTNEEPAPAEKPEPPAHHSPKPEDTTTPKSTPPTRTPPSPPSTETPATSATPAPATTTPPPTPKEPHPLS